MATLLDLPPHVWALILRNATIHDLHCVAHTCRALHELIHARAACTCAQGSVGDANAAPAFWAHWHSERSFPRLAEEWLMVASHNGLVAHVALALRCGVDPAIDDQRALCEASANGHVAVVDLLLHDERVDPSAGTQTPVCDASERGHAPVVERLLRDPRVDPSIYFQWPLVRACEHGHLAVVECLLRDERVQPSVLGQTPLSTACRKGHLSVVERLLRDERVARDVAALRKCITKAREAGHVGVVQLLQRHCASRRAV